jgi:hypothetical protein
MFDDARHFIYLPSWIIEHGGPFRELGQLLQLDRCLVYAEAYLRGLAGKLALLLHCLLCCCM